jgi:hypothetical protein
MEGMKMRGTANKPVRLVNVFFWQLAGIVIGGLIPLPIFGIAARYSQQAQPFGWVCLAVMVGFVTAAIGGTVGTLIGIRDRTSPFDSKRDGPTDP